MKPGARYRCHPIGVLQVDAIVQTSIGKITEQDAERCGFSSRAELLLYLGSLSQVSLTEDSQLYRVSLHYAGDGDRVPLALEAKLTPDEAAEIAERLRKMDASSSAGLWTRQTLQLIENQPRVAASKLAKTLGRETAPFKADVVKLKKLGLTQSFEVGYEVSPRGRAFLDLIRRREG